jgi:hypothetical protein
VENAVIADDVFVPSPMTVVTGGFVAVDWAVKPPQNNAAVAMVTAPLKNRLILLSSPLENCCHRRTR